MMMYGYGSSIGWALSMFLSMLLPVIMIAGIIYLAYILWEKKKKAPIEPSQTPLNILKKRYASGEITKEEFLSMKEDLLKE